MIFNIISNLLNGIGLQRDYEILREELEEHGHQVNGVQFDAIRVKPPKADVNLFLEVITPEFFGAAREQWVIPNPEWWFPKYNHHLPHISRIYCKTYDSLQLFTDLAGGKRVKYLGFMSRDLYQPTIVREHSFLHVAGNSFVKNTEAILKAWESVSYPLFIVTTVGKFQHQAKHLSNVFFYTRIPDTKLITLMNRNQFHLCPSKYEGFGHYLHEGQGCGAIVITGDGPPMNEFGVPQELLLPTKIESKLKLADMRSVEARDIVGMVTRVTAMTAPHLQELSNHSRAMFLQQRIDFKQNFAGVMRTC